MAIQSYGGKAFSVPGVLAMFAYGSVPAMILGLKFHLKAIFFWGGGGLRFAI